MDIIYYYAALCDESGEHETIVRFTEREMRDHAASKTAQGWHLIGVWMVEVKDGNAKATILD